MQSFEIGFHFHPYKIILTQELHINDEACRLRYCQWFLLNIIEENYYFSKYICSRMNDTMMATLIAITYITGISKFLTRCTVSAYSSQIVGECLGGYSRRDHIIRSHFFDQWQIVPKISSKRFC